MENMTRILSEMLHKKKTLYQELASLLSDEKEYIVNMDVSGLWTSSDRKKKLVSGIQQVSISILNRFAVYSDAPDAKTKPLNVSDVINGLPSPDRVKSELKSLWNSIKGLREETAAVSRENKRFITDYLSVIDDIFSAAGNPKAEKHYSNAGLVAVPAANSNRLISTKV